MSDQPAHLPTPKEITMADAQRTPVDVDLPAYHAELVEVTGPVGADRTLVRLVVVLLGLLAIIATAGVVLLANRSLPIPDALIAIGSATIGALGALLAKTSSAG